MLARSSVLAVTAALAVTIALAACGGAKPAPDGSSAARPHRLESELALLAGDHARCAEQSERAAALDPKSADDAYQAAICRALAGQPDAAFRALDLAIARGLHDVELIRIDPELARLHDDPRWPAAIARARARLDAHLAKHNAELYRLMIEDQQARTADLGDADLEDLLEQDAARLARVREIVAAGGAKTADDHYNAAVVFQHGQRPEDYRMAHTLALRAAELDPGLRGAKWLAAAAADRELTSQGKPQRFGTQLRGTAGGGIELHPVEPGVTDEERARWHVRPLAEQRRLLEARNAARSAARTAAPTGPAPATSP